MLQMRWKLLRDPTESSRSSSREPGGSTLVLVLVLVRPETPVVAWVLVLVLLVLHLQADPADEQQNPVRDPVFSLLLTTSSASQPQLEFTAVRKKVSEMTRLQDFKGF